ncbi:enoyl-CoA hydratase/carnithine racemase [Aquimarina sp. MAR_2010_214]|uniref:enoyl-CoA hydratase/isomerase family protein n=1 Tax=Aquimarina sp. MAR_2010_214 TaxID=1250026 RepID=UPI000C70A5BE|nr:enoyl-CoA hydratase/isomerase family protein [Aquimarina sp. MAR_2010_214]PKV48236.1 enoyl-CoA hydratase/carnithine racemase [Aquimarina sp. MAR_2010_214]
MNTTEFKTFNVTVKNAQAWVTFDYAPVNIQGIPMLDDLNNLAEQLENDRSIKVVVFQSAHPEIFVAHADTNFLKDMSTVAVPREEVKTLYIQDVLNRISKLPQATIAKVEGFARGGGHEFMLACDMRFAARGKAKFMQMEVGMGILPCGGGSARMARQVGLGKALEIILMAKDFDADEAERFGTINRALDASEIGNYVEELADRISKFPAESIEACKRTVYASVDLSIDDAIKEEAYWLYQSMSKTPAQKRFQYADDNGAQFDMNNQRAWNDLVIGIQDVK